jgi:hypothetical protein
VDVILDQSVIRISVLICRVIGDGILPADNFDYLFNNLVQLVLFETAYSVQDDIPIRCENAIGSYITRLL